MGSRGKSLTHGDTALMMVAAVPSATNLPIPSVLCFRCHPIFPPTIAATVTTINVRDSLPVSFGTFHPRNLGMHSHSAFLVIGRREECLRPRPALPSRY